MAIAERWRQLFPVSTELSYFLDHSLAEMESLKQWGRISDKVYGHYCFLWLWSAQRHDYRHEELYRKLGSKRYWRRIDRIKALAERIRPLRANAKPEDVPFALGRLNR
jgi:hypothetical protein